MNHPRHKYWRHILTATLSVAFPALVFFINVNSHAVHAASASHTIVFDRYDSDVDGKPVLVVVPREAAPGKPWVWHGEFFGHKPAPDIALLGKGFHIVYMSLPDMLGCPEAVAHWNART